MKNNKDKIRKIEQITDHGFLNFYELEAVNRKGESFPYYMASRCRKTDDLEIFHPEREADGVTMYSLYGPDADRVVLVRQFRYALGGYVYEFPAGLKEPGESIHDTAVREMREETGLDFIPLQTDPCYERAFFTTVGMTDEKCSLVFGYADGEISGEGLEASEDLEVVLADRKEARRILHEERVALPCAYMLMHFISGTGDPFAFLKEDMG